MKYSFEYKREAGQNPLRYKAYKERQRDRKI